MKNFKAIVASALCGIALLVGASQEASAAGPLRFGVKAGVAVNSLKLSESTFSADNRAGFTGGLTCQFVAPIINIGVDASVMYVRRASSDVYTYEDGSVDKFNLSNHYIDIPINFRYNLGLPGIGKIITPYIFTGPDFSFLLSKKNVKEVWNNRKFDVAWNFGLGVKLVNHVEIGASYGLGITKSGSIEGDALYGNNLLNGKNRCWTITAAYLF